jgi:hypothetical protein
LSAWIPTSWRKARYIYIYIYIYNAQVKYLSDNLERLESNIVEKRKNLEAVTMVMQVACYIYNIKVL